MRRLHPDKHPTFSSLLNFELRKGPLDEVPSSDNMRAATQYIQQRETGFVYSAAVLYKISRQQSSFVETYMRSYAIALVRE